MPNFTNIPLLNPIKFVPSVVKAGLNFDDDWCYNLIKDWERKVCYKQPWVKFFTTTLVMESTVAPSDLEVYNNLGVKVNTIPWIPVYAAVSPAGTLYKLTLQLDSGTSGALPTGVYYLYGQVTNNGTYNFEYISEPICVKTSFKSLSLFEYWSDKNVQDVFFPVYDNLVFKVLIEAQLCEFTPESDYYDYINQTHDAVTLSGVPWRGFKLLMGWKDGMADYRVDLVNRILCLKYKRFNGALISKQTGAKWEVQRTKGYPLAGWGIDVLCDINKFSLQYNISDPVMPFVFVTWTQNDDLFGGTSGNNVQILDPKSI